MVDMELYFLSTNNIATYIGLEQVTCAQNNNNITKLAQMNKEGRSSMLNICAN